MLRSLLMTLTICVTAAICAPTQAAAVRFAGTLTDPNGDPAAVFAGRTVILDAGWNTTGVSTTPLTFFALNVTSGGPLFLGGATGAIQFSKYGASLDRVRVTNGGPIVAGGNTLTAVNLFLDSSTSNATTAASQGNWDQIYAAMNNVNSGGFGVKGKIFIDTIEYTFSGAAVPEPGSIALLSGMGLVFGAVRRRRQTRATAV